MIHFILAIDWTDPKVFGPLVGAAGVIVGAVVKPLITGVIAVWAKKKDKRAEGTPSRQQSVTQSTSPTINVEASPKQEQSQYVQVGLDKKGSDVTSTRNLPRLPSG